MQISHVIPIRAARLFRIPLRSDPTDEMSQEQTFCNVPSVQSKFDQ